MIRRAEAVDQAGRREHDAEQRLDVIRVGHALRIQCDEWYDQRHRRAEQYGRNDRHQRIVHAERILQGLFLALGVHIAKDGLHAGDSLEINGGTINIKESNEGIEAETITVNNGTVTVNAKDDGINATSDEVTPVITFNGGTVTLHIDGSDLDGLEDGYEFVFDTKEWDRLRSDLWFRPTP